MEGTVLIRLAPDSETAAYCQAESGAAPLSAGLYMATSQAVSARSASKWSELAPKIGRQRVLGSKEISRWKIGSLVPARVAQAAARYE